MDFEEWIKARGGGIEVSGILCTPSFITWTAARKGMVPVERLKELIEQWKEAASLIDSHHCSIDVEGLIKEYGE